MENRKPVIITGTSSGIGLTTAVHLACKGFKVYATMRDVNRRHALEEEARRHNVSVDVLPCDITSQDDITAVIEHVIASSGRMYGLVNNAGINIRGFFEDLSDREMRAVLETNLFGTMAVTRSALPYLRSHRDSRIVIMSSSGGRIASPASSAYCTSKFALEGFGESLAQEMIPFGVHVSLVEPGLVATDLFWRNRKAAQQSGQPEGVYSPWFHRLERFTDAEVQTVKTPATHVAEAVWRALTAKRPRLRYVVGSRAKLLLCLRKRLPCAVFDSIWAALVNRAMGGRSPVV